MVTIQKDLDNLLHSSRKKGRVKQETRSKARVTVCEEFKLHYPDRWATAKAIIMRLVRYQRPHVGDRAATLDWWDDHLFAIIAPMYMEKRHRQQILRSLLRECGIHGVKTPKTQN